MTTRTQRPRYPRGSDLLRACMTYGLADLHDHTFPRPGVIRFFATPYGGAYLNLGHSEFEAEFRRHGGIKVTPLTTHTN